MKYPLSFFEIDFGNSDLRAVIVFLYINRILNVYIQPVFVCSRNKNSSYCCRSGVLTC